MKADLAFIKAGAGAILQLNDWPATLPLPQICGQCQCQLSNVSGSKISVFKEKLDQVIKKNEVLILEVLNKINQVLQGEEGATLPMEISPDAAASLKLCPIVFVDIVFVDVERSFSQFKNILTDRRHSFTQKNLTKYVVCNYFHTLGQ